MIEKLIYTIAIMAVVGFSVWTCGDHERRISYLEAVAYSATAQPDPACSVQGTTWADDVTVERGTLEFDGGEQLDVSGVHVDGVMEDGLYYPFADAEALPLDDAIECWITHYGPPGFPIYGSNPTASGFEIYEILGDDTHDSLIEFWSAEWGIPIDGFCAVRGIPWDITDPPTLLRIQGHGDYLIYDHKGGVDCPGVDIYEPEQESFPGGYGYSEPCYVWEIK